MPNDDTKQLIDRPRLQTTSNAKSYMCRRELLLGDLMSVGTYVCPACKQFFKTKEELEAHAKSAH